MTVIARSRARREINTRMLVAAERYLRLERIEPAEGEVEQLAARWTEELIASRASKLPEMPELRQYEDPMIKAAMGDLYGSISAVLDELYSAVVAGLDTHLTLDSVTKRDTLQVEGGDEDGGETGA